MKELELPQVEGASEHVTEDKAIAFAMYKDLNTIAVSTEHAFHMFDNEAELKHMKTVPLKNVLQICFVDEYVVLVTEDEDSDEAILTCYDFCLDDLQGEIKIKQFMGKKVVVRAAESSVCFAAGSQIGRI